MPIKRTVTNTINNASAEEIGAHFRCVGCRTSEDYQVWCEQNGLRSTVRKGRCEREREVALYTRLQSTKALSAARHFARHPETVLRDLSTGRFNVMQFGVRPYLFLLHRLFGSIGKGPSVRIAFLRLLQHTTTVADLEGVETVVDRYTNSYTFAHGLLALARHYKDWRQVPETWRPTSRSPRKQFGELARHLFCLYPPPAFLESAWFCGDDAAGRMAQSWYVQAGTGTSLRELGLPIRLTKRMAHAALNHVPANCTVEEGWRWAQVIGFGGSEALARAIIATRLGESLKDDDFWETVVQFFIANPLLDPARIGPLVDYLWHERYSPRRADDRTRLPVGFTMKGRTAAALLARVEMWHRQLTTAARISIDNWNPSGVGGYVEEEKSYLTHQVTRWTIQEITSAKALMAEGRAMSHCIATYGASCARGLISVWSLQADGERVMTIALKQGRTVTEARGRRNALPGKTVSDYGMRLSKEETTLLLRGRRIVRVWAQQERLSLPLYLMDA